MIINIKSLLQRVLHQGVVWCVYGATLAFSITSASASVISFSTRPASSGALGPFSNPGDYRSAWNNLVTTLPSAPSGYCDTTIPSWDPSANISNQGVCGGSPIDISFHFRVDFGLNSSQAGTIDFRIGPDFGLGGEVYLDNVPVAFNSNDMWWGFPGNWSAIGQIFQFSGLLGVGNHTIDVYGQEGCCDGGTGGQFTISGPAGFTSFASTDGLNFVPEPTTLALFAIGFLGLVRCARLKHGSRIPVFGQPHSETGWWVFRAQ